MSAASAALVSQGFALGGLVVFAWATRDVHRPANGSVVRFAVDRRRYAVAVGAYAAVVFAGYAFAVLAAQKANQVFGIAHSPSGIALAVALVLVAVVPHVPPTKELLRVLRRVAMRFAGYPDAAERLVARMLRPEQPDPAAVSSFDEALADYGSDLDTVQAWLPRSALASLLEAGRLRARLKAMAAQADPAHCVTRRFFRNHERGLARLDTAWHKLVRRVAIASEMVTTSAMEAEDAAPVSEFLAEEAEAVLRGYQHVLAELALSCHPAGARRAEVLRSFGYEAHLDAPLPLVPILAVLVFEALLFAGIVAFALAGGGGPVPNPAVFGLHTTGMVLSVAWAIYPKFLLNSARPSLRTLPWTANALCAAVSYAFGVLVSFLALEAIAVPPMPPSVFVVGGSFFFAAGTLGVAVAVDLRLRDDTPATPRAAARDAICLVALMVGVGLCIRLVAVGLFHLEMSSPSARMLFMAGFGALIGWFVPATAVAYIRAGTPAATHAGQTKAVALKIADAQAAASLLAREASHVR